MTVKVDYVANKEPITVQQGYMDDDEFILENCNHAGAEIHVQQRTRSTFWADAGIHVPDDSEAVGVLVCDKCHAYNEDGIWIEE